MRHSLLGLVACYGVLLGCSEAGIKVEAGNWPPSNSIQQTADPALAVLPGSGDLVLSWIQGDGETWSLYVARQRRESGQWSSPVRVSGGSDAPGEVHPHGESSPRLVAASDARLALVWPNSIKVPGRKWPAAMLRFSRSEDGGRTWSPPITLNDDTTGALVSHQFHGATALGDSGLVVAWMDERHAHAPIAKGADGHGEHAVEPDATIYMTSSVNFGDTWTPNQVAGEAACPCCRVSLARSPGNEAIAAWRKHFPGNVRDVVTSSLTGGHDVPSRVYPDEWSYPGCPHSGPAMAISADGSRHVVWYNGRAGDAGVYYARTRGTSESRVRVGLVTGRKVTTAHPAVATVDAGGVLAAYDMTEKGERRIRVARISDSGDVLHQVTVPGSESGKYPQLAVTSDTSAVVAWTSTEGEKSRVGLARLEWNGR